MPYQSATVANRILDRAKAANVDLTPLQLLKLAYIAHGWSLGLNGRPLVNETAEAWRYGPVLPQLYKAIKNYGSSPVTQPVRDFFGRGQTLADDDRELIDDVFAKYGHLSGVQLSNLTHRAGTPWDTCFNPSEFHIPIPNGIIANHYRALAQERAA